MPTFYYSRIFQENGNYLDVVNIRLEPWTYYVGKEEGGKESTFTLGKEPFFCCTTLSTEMNRSVKVLASDSKSKNPMSVSFGDWISPPANFCPFCGQAIYFKENLVLRAILTTSKRLNYDVIGYEYVR